MLRRILALAITLLAFAPASAKIITYDFSAQLSGGPLDGTAFPGTFSYDDSQVTGIGTEYFGLHSLNFTLKGVAFDKSDIDQGGQVILQNGVLEDFTAAIFPPTPWPAPVSDIAFGFGGPGVIGYIAGAGVFGSGSYTISPAAVPEPWTLAVFAFGLIALAMRPHHPHQAVAAR